MRINLREKIKIKPFIYEKLNSEKSIKLLKKYSINNSENNTLIYDLMEYINIKNNTLYFTDIYEEYIDLKQKNKINNSNNINYLLKKHFPYSNLNFNLKNIRNDYLLKRKIFEKEIKIDKIFEKNKNNNQYLGKCNIIFKDF